MQTLRKVEETTIVDQTRKHQRPRATTEMPSTSIHSPLPPRNGPTAIKNRTSDMLACNNLSTRMKGFCQDQMHFWLSDRAEISSFIALGLHHHCQFSHKETIAPSQNTGKNLGIKNFYRLQRTPMQHCRCTNGELACPYVTMNLVEWIRESLIKSGNQLAKSVIQCNGISWMWSWVSFLHTNLGTQPLKALLQYMHEMSQ